VIRRQPRNPIGWLLTSSGVVILGVLDAALYAVLDYRDHAGALPLGQEAVVVESAAFATVVLCGLTVPLFPDGHLPSPRWRWALAIYIGAGAMFTVSQVIEQVAAVTAAPVRVDGSGSPLASGSVSGVAAAVVGVGQGGYLVVLGLWLIFIGRQVVGYVRSSGDRRQQLKWLFSGAAVCLVATWAIIQAGSFSSPGWVGVQAACALGIAAFPVGIGVGILRYRMYDIDQIISRTVAYAVVTGVLVATYAALVRWRRW